MGKVVHFEIPTDDLDRAKAFYESVFGWELSTMEMPGGGDYTGATTAPTDETMTPTEPGAINGALVRRDEGNSAPVVTIDVDDINAALEQISAAGGSTVTERTEIPGMGAFAYFKDSEGNVTGLWETPSGG